MTAAILDATTCRARQARLLEVLHARQLEAAVIVRPEHITWLTGVRWWHYFFPVAVLRADGHVTLVAPNTIPTGAAADEILVYEAQWHSTLRGDQRAAGAQVLKQVWGGWAHSRRVGIERSAFPPVLWDVCGGVASEWLDIEPNLLRLRRRKDEDELVLLRRAIAATGAMYTAAREFVRPGVNELDVFNHLQGVAVRACGEPLTGTGNDYACGVPSGPPRDRQAAAGELYILDLGPVYRGYNADNCRTLAVDGRPTDLQRRTWAHVAGVFPLAAALIRPGVSCREVYARIHRYLNEFIPGGFEHHLGHGIGLWPHELPYLNPDWDEVFAEGDVITLEPGLYSPELHGGIRLENDYRVTDAGLELLSEFPLEL